MATLLSLAQLLCLGALLVPAQAQTERCDQLVNATTGSFSVTVTPEVFQANTTYTVTINSTGNSTVEYLLQALTLENESLGQWLGVRTENCTSGDTAVLNATQNEAQWTSPDTNVSSVQIRAYVIFTDKNTQLKTVMLRRGPGTTTSPPTTPNSVPRVRGSSFFLAVLQLPLLLISSKLLS